MNSKHIQFKDGSNPYICFSGREWQKWLENYVLKYIGTKFESRYYICEGVRK